MATHRIGASFRVRGLRLTDHFFDVPLDHGFNSNGSRNANDSSTIEVFAREVVAADKKHDDASLASMPWLVYLQGGPGFRVREAHRKRRVDIARHADAQGAAAGPARHRSIHARVRVGAGESRAR